MDEFFDRLAKVNVEDIPYIIAQDLMGLIDANIQVLDSFGKTMKGKGATQLGSLSEKAGQLLSTLANPIKVALAPLTLFPRSGPALYDPKLTTTFAKMVASVATDVTPKDTVPYIAMLADFYTSFAVEVSKVVKGLIDRALPMLKPVLDTLFCTVEDILYGVGNVFKTK